MHHAQQCLWVPQMLPHTIALHELGIAPQDRTSERAQDRTAKTHLTIASQNSVPHKPSTLLTITNS